MAHKTFKGFAGYFRLIMLLSHLITISKVLVIYTNCDTEDTQRTCYYKKTI